MIAFITAAYLCLMPMEMHEVKVPEYVAEENCSVILNDNGISYFIDQDAIDLMARVVMSEAGNQSDDCKEAVATVILNRWRSPKYPGDLKKVIVPGQFSVRDNGAPTEDCYLAVYSAITFWGSDFAILPKQVYYFRAGHYHSWALDYCKIDQLYFSTPTDICIE